MKKLLLVLALAMAFAIPGFAQQPILQSSTAYKITFLMVDSSDHITGKTGLTPTVTLSKAGGSFGSPSGAVTELSGGWYVIAGNATDTGTLGELLLHATSAGADPTDMRVGVVVAFNPQDGVHFGLTGIPNAAAGASGGLLINGSNSGTITLAALTVTGSFTISDGLLVARSSSNTSAITATGNGTGSGAVFTSGSGATGDGAKFTSAATAGQGLAATGNGTGHGVLATSGGGATGDGFKAISAATNGNGLNGVGTGTGADIKGSGLEQLVSKAVASSFSSTVAANSVIGYLADVSATSSYDRTTMSFEAAFSNAPTVANMATAVWQDTTSGDFTTASSIGKSLYTSGAVPGAAGGLFIAGTNAATTITTALTTTFTGNVTGSVGSVASGGITATSIADAAIDRATFAADTGMQSARSNTAQAGAATTITLDASASASNSFYNNDKIYITGGTGVGQSRFITAYNGTTKVATVATWVTNPDNTSTFAIEPFDAISGASAPTAAQVATAVWQDATSGDFTASSSIGKSLYTSGAVPGAAGGVFIAGTNAATTITTGLTTHFIGTVDAVTTVNGLASNVITAASIATDADTEIENAVLNATTAGHATAGSIGKAIGDASSAGDPWGTSLPGSYGSGTAGYIIGTNIQPVKTIKKGEAFTNVPIWMLSTTGAAVTGLTTSQISCQISIDGGSWNALTDTTETEIGLGKYVVDLSSGETNGNSVSLDCSATGAQHYRTNLTPQR